MASVCDVFFYHDPFKHIFAHAFNLYPVWKNDFRGGVLVASGDLKCVPSVHFTGNHGGVFVLPIWIWL